MSSNTLNCRNWGKLVMLISEKYNTRIGKYISRELVENLESTANMLNMLRRAGAIRQTFSGFTGILVKDGHGHTLLY